MKQFFSSILVVFFVTIFSLTCNAEAKYKGFLNIGGGVMSGDTYNYVMGCDGKIGFTLSMEHGVIFSTNNVNAIFFGGGVGYDYVNVALDTFDEELIETKNILSNSVKAIPLYVTVKYIWNVKHISMAYSVRGGYYKWFRGHYVNEQAEAKDYKIPYQGSYTFGFGIGIRLPINIFGENKYGVSLMYNYDYIGANTKWQGCNIENNKTSISISLDF